MTLSECEKSYIIAEQKRQARWLRNRWAYVVVSILVISGSLINMKRLVALEEDSNAPVPGLLWFWPFCWFVLLGFSGWLAYTIAHWRGDISTSLLLKLIREHEAHEDLSRKSE